MSRYVSVSIDQGVIPNPQNKGAALTIPSFTITLELGSDGRWRIPHGEHAAPYVRAVLGYTGQGYYDENFGLRWFTLYDETRKNEILVLRGVENSRGPAFAWPEGNRYRLEGRWRPGSQGLPQTWIGFMGKASLNVVIGGEVGYGALFSITTNQKVVFKVSSGRLGAVAGFSGGLAFVLATGFQRPGDFQDYSSSGADWALSIGAKASGVLKSGSLVAAFKKFEGGLDGVDAVIRRLRDSDLTRELHTIGKNVCATCLIDTEERGVSAFDIPLLGAGAEAGIFYAWSNFDVLRHLT